MSQEPPRNSPNMRKRFPELFSRSSRGSRLIFFAGRLQLRLESANVLELVQIAVERRHRETALRALAAAAMSGGSPVKKRTRTFVSTQCLVATLLDPFLGGLLADCASDRFFLLLEAREYLRRLQAAKKVRCLWLGSHHGGPIFADGPLQVLARSHSQRLSHCPRDRRLSLIGQR